MATKLMYLEDFDVVTCDAHVQTVEQGDDGRAVITLDQTCFYPRGGGQDWDEGTIKGPNGVLDVSEVRLDEDGVVQHLGTLEGEIKPGDEVSCKVDEKRRSDNTRLHSAGHLVDMAVQQLGWPWEPGKGAHYPHMSFVEYDAPEAVITDGMVEQLQRKLDDLVQNGVYENKILFMPVEEMHKYCRHVPTNIPANKPARIVLYADDFGIPCGGTHVRRVSDIGRVVIPKVKAKKGIVKVSYRVEGVN